MNVFISGGCKNGKSMFAQTIARDMAQEKKVELYYLATMRPVDEEDLARIKRHMQEREGWGFTTVEQSENICECLSFCEKMKKKETERRIQKVYFYWIVSRLFFQMKCLSRMEV
ncbi:bifunctional adenosylcobinamide kinase/adenosylcobinamide-phosphate guanylyltransferase [Aminipila terrae]|uniref:Uncharacterized protein n=1 Tax=Aminipila terrae TaxID=2697030 RepID=A0A6P1MDJ9_9FIRM|nr:bifunctional adenosylcobinamide kinase/adenosylcobinamide-phosphate guanylyltransferase [Aminipila terrae]QHI72759.1 hypothetical protein Ami3637_10395 [Aminipila terrae]